MPEERENTQLGDAIVDSQRKAISDQQWSAHTDRHNLAAELRSETNNLRWDDHKREHAALAESVDEKSTDLRSLVGETLAAHAREHVLDQLNEDAAFKDVKDISVLHWAAHVEQHTAIERAIQAALTAVDRERVLHATAHEAAHQAHEREHKQQQAEAEVRSETATSDRELRASAHSKEHLLEAVARDKAESAVNLRLEGMNEVRGQLKEQAITFARVDALSALTDRVIAIEKLDIRGEGQVAQADRNRALNQWTFERVLTVIALAAGLAYFLVNNAKP